MEAIGGPGVALVDEEEAAEAVLAEAPGDAGDGDGGEGGLGDEHGGVEGADGAVLVLAGEGSGEEGGGGGESEAEEEEEGGGEEERVERGRGEGERAEAEEAEQGLEAAQGAIERRAEGEERRRGVVVVERRRRRGVRHSRSLSVGAVESRRRQSQRDLPPTQLLFTPQITRCILMGTQARDSHPLPASHINLIRISKILLHAHSPVLQIQRQ